MGLSPIQIGLRQAARIQAFVHIAVEGQHRLLAVVGGEGGAPGTIASDVQRGQRVAQVHQGGNLGGGIGLQHLDQRGRLVNELRQGVALRGGRGVVIEALGRGQQEQHLGKMRTIGGTVGSTMTQTENGSEPHDRHKQQQAS